MDRRELKQIARNNLSDQWGKAIGVTFLAGILGGLIAGAGFISLEIDLELVEVPKEFLGFLAVYGSICTILSGVQFIFGGVIQLAYADCLLRQYDRKDYEVKDLFAQFDRFGEGFLQAFLRGLFIFLWSLLLIIPGFIKAHAYSMTPFIMAERPDLKPLEAMKASEELMKGHKMELFVLGLSFIGWNLLSFLTLGIGFLFLNPYLNATYAAFYKKLCNPNPAENF